MSNNQIINLDHLNLKLSLNLRNKIVNFSFKLISYLDGLPLDDNKKAELIKENDEINKSMCLLSPFDRTIDCKEPYLYISYNKRWQVLDLIVSNLIYLNDNNNTVSENMKESLMNKDKDLIHFLTDLKSKCNKKRGKRCD